MPELPEVESIRKGLNHTLKGLTVVNSTVLKGKIVSSNSNIRIVDDYKIKEFNQLLLKSQFISVSRKSKQLIIKTDKCDLVIHLKMTGQLIHTFDETRINKHTCVILELSDNSYLIYNDVRQFGYVLACKNYSDTAKLLDTYGYDPQTDTIDNNVVYDKFQKSKSPIKQVLLNQKVICGLGNIYCDEVLFDSQLSPSRLVNTLTYPDVDRLIVSTYKIINHAIAEGGSSISDYMLSDGSKGGYAKFHKVYGRKNRECVNCNANLFTTVLGGRTTVFCGKCQK
jgi:formamidopyrimidine-DNA glycosylase